MKGSLVLLSFAALFASSFALIDDDDDLEDFCEIPQQVREAVVNCIVGAIDSVSLSKLRETEECAGATLNEALEDTCSSETGKLERLQECDKLGDIEPNVDAQKAVACIENVFLLEKRK